MYFEFYMVYRALHVLMFHWCPYFHFHFRVKIYSKHRCSIIIWGHSLCQLFWFMCWPAAVQAAYVQRSTVEQCSVCLQAPSLLKHGARQQESWCIVSFSRWRFGRCHILGPSFIRHTCGCSGRQRHAQISRYTGHGNSFSIVVAFAQSCANKIFA